jgi:PAS domain S-box-containing protein/putative nucleotidyltransferase with HDIG domain
VIQLNKFAKWFGEFEAVKKDGSVFISQGFASSFMDENGTVIGYQSSNLDITRQKEDEKELLLKSTIVDNSLITMSAADSEGRINFANKRFLAVWGYSEKKEVLGKSISYFFEKIEEAEKVLASLRSKDYWIGEFTGIRKDKSLIKLSAYATSVYDKSDNLIGYQASCVDVTEKDRMLKAFEDSENRFRELFNKMWSGIAIYTPLSDGSDFIVKDINNSGSVLSKVKKESVVGKLVTEAFPGIKEFGLFSIFQKVNETGKPKHHPVKFYKDNNMRAWFENYVFKLPSGEIVAIYNDVTTKKNNEEKIIDAKENQEKLTNKLHKNLIDTVLALSATVEYRDKYTAGHSKNVASLACAIAEELGLLAEKIEALRMAGVLHDIGKIAIPMAILGKPEPLMKQEYELIKTHSQVGYDLIKHIEFTHPIARMILEHHERTDGSGYPNGKKDHDILLESKILAVADVVEAMSLSRPYRKALGTKKALEEIINNSGVKFDSDVVHSCVKLFREKGFKIVQ